jgi:hypothetical protein
MTTPAASELTQLLVDRRRGDAAALDRLMPLVYQELRRIARRYMRGERAGHMLQSAALVNEPYLRLIDIKRIDWIKETAEVLGVSHATVELDWTVAKAWLRRELSR